MKGTKLVIFGIGKIAEVVHYYATEECDFDVVGFCVDDEYATSESFLNTPVIGISQLNENYPPSEHKMFVAVGYHDLNKLRKNKCEEVKQLGYELVSIVPDSANVPANVKYGSNCFIMPPAIIHPCVSIGDNVFVWNGAMIGHHSKVGDHCWLTSTCSIGGGVAIGELTFLAMSATISNSVNVGKECFLGANVLVTKHMEDMQVVIAESSKPIRLNSKQFLKMSSFSSL